MRTAFGKEVFKSFSVICSGETRGFGSGAVKFLLLFLSYLYYAASFLNRKYSRAARIERPVISVGNIVCGGTGKTPAVEYIASMLLERGLRPAVLSRGYMGKLSSTAVVSDGKNLLIGPDDGGDEPVMLAENLPGVPVLSGKNRYAAGCFAVREMGASCVVLDDGFQHYNLARDIDIVVIDSSRPFGNGHLLPRGELREKPASLRRADLLILTHVNFCDDLNRVKKAVAEACGNKPMVETVHMPVGLKCLNNGERLPPGGLNGKKAVALSGIGRHSLFEKTVQGQGIAVLESLVFPDHYAYSRKDIESVCGSALRLGADCIVTTAKDAVRLRKHAAALRVKIYAVEIRLYPVGGEDEMRKIFEVFCPGGGG
jgi:tetraacyldisaccharide 4'-kinase